MLTSADLTTRSGEDIIAANRRALESRAGKDSAKVMLRSEPKSARVWINGKEVGKTPLLLIVPPGVYKVEMEDAQTEANRKQVELGAKETREVMLSLRPRYPAHIQLSWPHH